MIFAIGLSALCQNSPCWRIRKSAPSLFISVSCSLYPVGRTVEKVSGKLGQSSNRLNRGGGARRQIGKKIMGAEVVLFVCLFDFCFLMADGAEAALVTQPGDWLFFSVWLTVNK